MMLKQHVAWRKHNQDQLSSSDIHTVVLLLPKQHTYVLMLLGWFILLLLHQIRGKVYPAYQQPAQNRRPVLLLYVRINMAFSGWIGSYIRRTFAPMLTNGKQR